MAVVNDIGFLIKSNSGADVPRHAIEYIANGKIVANGTPEELKAHPSRRILQFMHGDPDGPVPFHYPADDLKYDVLSETG